MPLSLIAGPPNSGKAGEIVSRLRAALPRDPVLVVPTIDDAHRFERELCGRGDGGGSVLGVSIGTFERLFEEVAAATGATSGARPTLAQSLGLARLAATRERPRLLARSAARPGFATALVQLADELGGAGADPRTLAELAADPERGSPYLAELTTLHAAYLAILSEHGLDDPHATAARASAALRAHGDAWEARPVLLYGFDDLTAEQLDLVAALARVADVTVSVAYDAERPALAARARLHQQLVELGGAIAASTQADPRHTHSPALFHVERNLLTETPPRIEPDAGLAWLEAAGERGQAEQVAAEIARLLADGVEPGAIAVALRNPRRDGLLFESVLERLEVPAAVEAQVPLASTGVGAALAGLVRVFLPGGAAGDLLAYLRAPGAARANEVDWLERAIRRGALRTSSEALGAWRGRDLFELDDLRAARDGAGVLAALARFARALAERPHLRRAPLAQRGERLELRAGATAANAMAELAELRSVAGAEPAHAAREALAVLRGLEVPLWRGSTEGRVRVTSPYRLRAGRVDHLFCVSLQEGEFPRLDVPETLLSDDARAVLALPPRADQADEERYLLAICVSRPVRRLHLCWRSCDDEGAEAAPSPFLDAIRDLLHPPPPPPGEPDPLAGRVHRRRLDDVVFPPADAPSVDELARALAGVGLAPEGVSDAATALGLNAATATELAARLGAAAAMRSRRKPGPLAVERVLAELRRRELFGASTLESFRECSYRWFVSHELDPEALEPEPDARAQGAAIHAVLERLYRQPPGDEPLPRPQTLAAWRDRAAKLLEGLCGEFGLGGDDARCRAARARMLALIGGELEREAALEPSLHPDPELIEARFGEREDDARAPLELGGFRLHGKIDRVDVPAGGEPAGLVRDYKVAREVTKGANLDREGKLQPQLYALALNELWNRRALGGVYVPLAATGDHAPRGIALRDEADGLLDGLGLAKHDLLTAEEFDAALEQARSRAREVVERMRGGDIRRDPLDDECPRYCTYATICRRERAARQRDPEEEVEEGAEE